MTESNPFQFADSISLTKNDLIRNGVASEKEYNSYLMNRQFSLFSDSIFDAQEMNKRSSLDPLMQYDYMRTSLRKAKRYTKWPKRVDSDDIIMIADRFQISLNNARAALKILTRAQLDELKTHSEKGGLENKNGKIK